MHLSATMPHQFTQAQQQRLRFIDFCLHYFGEIARADLIAKFQIGLASCTRDLALYKELAPQNLELRHQTKLYYRTKQFQPLFLHDGMRNNLQALLTQEQAKEVLQRDTLLSHLYITAKQKPISSNPKNNC